MHECNFSKKKSAHFFSFDHQCKKTSCTLAEKPSTQKSVSKIPCCEVETKFVQSQDFTPANRTLSTTQAILLSSIFQYILPQNKLEKKELIPIEPEPKHFGFQYRIALQSFLC